MHCPFCRTDDTKVIVSRLASEGTQVRRRRECLACGERFTTFESAELVMPRIIKNNGAREPYDEKKLAGGIFRSLEKRPVGIEAIEDAVSRIMRRVRATGDREVASRDLGELVMEELRELDEVAYVRFASVYRRFQDVQEFREEVERLQEAASGNREQMSLLGDEDGVPDALVTEPGGPAHQVQCLLERRVPEPDGDGPPLDRGPGDDVQADNRNDGNQNVVDDQHVLVAQ